jgi:hypothetical protein
MVLAIILFWQSNSALAQLTRAQAAIEFIANKYPTRSGSALCRNAAAAENHSLLFTARSRIRGSARRIP